MKLQITFTPDQYWKIGFAAHCIALWLRLLFLLNSSRAKRRSKLAIHAAAKILPYYRRTNASLMGKNLQKKILFFFFNPHGTEKMPCYLDCFYSHVLRQNLPFLLPLEAPKHSVFVQLPPDSSLVALGGEKLNVFLRRWMTLGRYHLSEFPSSWGNHYSIWGERLLFYSYLVPKHPGKVLLSLISSPTLHPVSAWRTRLSIFSRFDGFFST